MTLDEIKAELDRAGMVAGTLNGAGPPGWSTLCPLCPGEIHWREGDRAWTCQRDGCDPSRIADEIHMRASRTAWNTSTPTGDEPPEPQASCWEPVDLEPILAGEQPEERPDILRRSDGVGLLYPGRLHAGYGEPEACKGWWVQADG
jgi:hypothetical protein